MLKKEPKKTNEEKPLKKKNRNLPTVEEATAEDEPSVVQVTKELQFRNLTKNCAHPTVQTNPTPPSCIPHRTLIPSCQKKTVTKEHNVSIATLE